MNYADQKEAQHTLEVLETIEKQSDVTQRYLAGNLGVALGLANSYIRRCVRKGLIKIHQAPTKRYLYYLTPKGFTEKSRLTAEYLHHSFGFYRRASSSCMKVFEQCKENGYQKILLCGVSELAEIASLRARDKKMDVVGVFDRVKSDKDFIGFPVCSDIEALPEFDACIMTDVNNPIETLEFLYSRFDKKIVFTPEILGISKDIQTES